MTYQIGDRVYVPNRDEHMTVIGLVEWQAGMFKAVRLRGDMLDDEPLMEPCNIVPSIVRPRAVVIPITQGPGSAS